jgi:3'(2'), 5'-bisphosphate nucleotidase
MHNTIDFAAVVQLAKKAGNAIMAIYGRDFSVETKTDNSPLTEADLAAHHCIIDGLSIISPTLPVLSEESNNIDWQTRCQWDSYWLIDPLDGTKEFIKRNGEFTVNIALINNNRPVWGVVYAPAKELLYYGGQLQGQSIREIGNDRTIIHCNPVPATAAGWKIVGSKSHQSDEFVELVKRFSEPVIVNLGSSLKICMVAEGSADLYPRLGLTSEWDTAAAHAVLQGAGGELYNADTLTALQYNTKEILLNPFFHALGKTDSFTHFAERFLHH